MRTIYKAGNIDMVQPDNLQTVFVSEIGQIEVIDNLVRFTLCERMEMANTPVLIPRICVLRTLESITRDGALVKQHLGVTPQFQAVVENLTRPN